MGRMWIPGIVSHMSSGEWHSAWVLTVRRRLSQMVGLESLPQFDTMGPPGFALRNFGSIVMSPAAGVHAGTDMFLLRSCALVMPLYRNFGIVPSMCPALFRVPSHVSHPIEQPLLNQKQACGAVAHLSWMCVIYQGSKPVLHTAMRIRRQTCPLPFRPADLAPLE